MSSITAADELQGFIHESAKNLGIDEDVILEVSDRMDDMSTTVVSRVIHISKDILCNYGAEDTGFDLLIDEFPDDPGLLHKHLYSLNSSKLDILKKYYRPTLSTIEIESGTLHELGHIKLNHLEFYEEQSVHLNHKNELSADAISCTTFQTRKGRIRFEKRCILESFIFLGPKKYEQEQKKVCRSHPSHVERLKQAYQFDQIFKLLGGSHQQAHQGVSVDRVTKLDSL